jgi:hypothetical protein
VAITSDNEPASDAVADVPLPPAVEIVLSALDINAVRRSNSESVVKNLLESDDSSDSSSDEVASRCINKPTFVKEEIVWELWHRGNRRLVAVQDEDLLANQMDSPGRQPVTAQLAMVANVQRVKKKGLVLGLLTLTDGMGEAFSLDRPFRLVAAKSVRKFGTCDQDQMILHSQQSAPHFATLKSVFEDAKRYAHLHRSLQLGKSGLLTVGQFFSLDRQSRQTYISSVTSRTLVQQPFPLIKQEPAPSPDAASASANINLTLENFKNSPSHSAWTQPDSISHRRSPTMWEMVHPLPAACPPDWMPDPALLQQIAAAAKDFDPQALLHHEVFFDPKEREAWQGWWSRLIKAINPALTTMFEAADGGGGGQQSAGEMYRMVEVDLHRILLEQQEQRTLDRRLRQFFKSAISPQVKLT